MAPELQQRVHAEVEQTRQRSGWSVQRTLAALGIPRSSYYRWLHEEAWARQLGVQQRVDFLLQARFVEPFGDTLVNQCEQCTRRKTAWQQWTLTDG